MQYIGVDACKKGWFAVSIGPDGRSEIGIFETIGDLWDALQCNALILIDIPIGLPDDGKRRCDVEARRLLKKRAASVFPVPCRQAIHADTYMKACLINQKILGVKLSVQTWNLAGKIRDVDELLRYSRKARQCMRESHPEICFWALAGERPMAHYKKTDRGFGERLRLLKKINPAAEIIFNTALKNYPRRYLAADDILDAIALAVTASAGMHALTSIPENPLIDSMDLPMEIVYRMMH
jgi:predicted RNase H-like nuclease